MADKPTVADMMEAYALDAVDHARSSKGVELDFSIESVRHVESILETMYDSKPKGFVSKLFSRGPSQQTIDTFSKMYGAYIGEVLRRHSGGDWSLDPEFAAPTAIVCLKKGESRLWPPAKVRKRLTNGPEDNVWFYFHVIKDRW